MSYVALINGKRTGPVIPGATVWEALDYVFGQYSHCTIIADAKWDVGRAALFDSDKKPVAVIMIVPLIHN